MTSFTALTIKSQRMSIIDELRHELYSGTNVFDFAEQKYEDGGYPHTFIVPELIEAVLTTVKPAFWLEIGSMVGGSAIKTAQAADKLSLKTEIVCIDPFCGDVNSWSQETRPAIEWKCLRLEKGLPTLYERFLANVSVSGYGQCILPIPVTSTIGIKLLHRLFTEKRIAQLPSVIYLDSAHELNETLLELQLAWSLLPKGGILMGDDWNWRDVCHDVTKFSGTISQNKERGVQLAAALSKTSRLSVKDGVTICHSRKTENPVPQWLLFK